MSNLDIRKLRLKPGDGFLGHHRVAHVGLLSAGEQRRTRQALDPQGRTAESQPLKIGEFDQRAQPVMTLPTSVMSVQIAA